MTRKERHANIAAGMLHERGMTKEALIALLVEIGIKQELAEKAAAAEIARS